MPWQEHGSVTSLPFGTTDQPTNRPTKEPSNQKRVHREVAFRRRVYIIFPYRPVSPSRFPSSDERNFLACFTASNLFPFLLNISTMAFIGIICRIIAKARNNSSSLIFEIENVNNSLKSLNMLLNRWENNYQLKYLLSLS